jgi:hypothetical protein
VGDPADGDGLTAGGAVVGDPAGAGELLVGVAEGLGVCDGLGDCAGRGEVGAGLDVGAAEDEGLVVCWLAGAAVGTGRTRM